MYGHIVEKKSSKDIEWHFKRFDAFKTLNMNFKPHQHQMSECLAFNEEELEERYLLDCGCGPKLAIWIILSLITSRFCFDTKLTGSHLNLQFERIPTFCWQAVLVRVQQSFDSAALNANWIVFWKICPQKRQENEWMEINWIGLNLQAGNEGDIIKDCQPRRKLIRFYTFSLALACFFPFVYSSIETLVLNLV